MGELHSYNFRTNTTNPLVIMEWELGILKVGILKREKMLWGDGNVIGCEGGYMDVWVSQDFSNCTPRRRERSKERKERPEVGCVVAWGGRSYPARGGPEDPWRHGTTWGLEGKNEIGQT